MKKTAIVVLIGVLAGSLVILLSPGTADAEQTGLMRRANPLPAEMVLKPIQQHRLAAGTATECELAHDNAVAASFFGGMAVGERIAVLYDPAACPGVNPGDFIRITGLGFTLYDWGPANWPVHLRVGFAEVVDDGGCGYPTDFAWADTITVTEEDFGFPNLTFLGLTDVLCTDQPFYVIVEYTGVTPAPFPSLVFDEQTPSSCTNMYYYNAEPSGWYYWDEVFEPPTPGNTILRVIIETDPGTDCDFVGGDTDGDGVPDAEDNCPNVANATQSDVDGDGIGNACDACTDTDGDGWGNPGFTNNTCPDDNCPTISNVTQADSDGDGIGDACDCDCSKYGDVAPLPSAGDGHINVLDMVAVIDFVFRSGPALPADSSCPRARGDVAPLATAGDGVINVLDVSVFIDYVMRSGPAFVDPCSQ